MKITIYELLGLIKDGKAPKKILLNGIVFEYQGDDYLYKDGDKKEHWLFSTSYTDEYIWLEKFLKVEVEIIEEPKKIEHCLKSDRFLCDKAEMEHLRTKIDELIDEVNKLKGEK